MNCVGISSGVAVVRMECYVKLATIKDHFKLLSFYLAPTNHPGILYTCSRGSLVFWATAHIIVASCYNQ